MGVFISIYMIDTPVAQGGLLKTCFHAANCYSWTCPQSALFKVPFWDVSMHGTQKWLGVHVNFGNRSLGEGFPWGISPSESCVVQR